MRSALHGIAEFVFKIPRGMGNGDRGIIDLDGYAGCIGMEPSE